MCSLISFPVLAEHPHLCRVSFGNHSHWHDKHSVILPQFHLNFCKSHVAQHHGMNLKKSSLGLIFLFMPKVEGVMNAVSKQSLVKTS